MRKEKRISVEAISIWIKWPKDTVERYVVRNRHFIPSLSGWSMSFEAALITAIGVFLDVKFDRADEFYHKTRRHLDDNRTPETGA
jgi:hypothetical protein